MALATLTLRSVLRCVVLILALLTIAAKAQLTPSADSYINTAAANTNYGSSKLLDVESTETTFIQFHLSAITPAAPASLRGTANDGLALVRIFRATRPLTARKARRKATRQNCNHASDHPRPNCPLEE